MNPQRALIFFLFLISMPLAAQFKNLKLDEANGQNQVCEPGVAINKKDPRNIVVSSTPDNVYHSVDGGLSWKKKKIISPFGVSGRTRLVTDDKDNFYFLHLSTVSGVQRIVSHESKDGGETWSEGELVDDSKVNLSKENRWVYTATDQKGNLYATWTQLDKDAGADSSCRSVILYSESTSGGKRWSTPVQLSQTPGTCADDDTMVAGSSSAVSFDGKVYAVWSRQEKIYFDRSFNGGDMWLSSDLPIADQSGGWNITIPGHSRSNGVPHLAVDYSKGMLRGSIYLIWADQKNGPLDTDVWFIRSHNGGDNWTQPVRISNDESQNHQYFPSMAIDQTTGVIYVVYYDRREYDDSRTDVYLAYSFDGGNYFENVKVSESPFVPQAEMYFGDYISIAAHNGIITPVWTRVDDGKTSVWTAIIDADKLPRTKVVKK